MTIPEPSKNAWVTLLTRASYLGGAVLLAHSLHRQRSKYPLLILCTPDFPSELLGPLKKEAALTNSSVRMIDHLRPKEKIDLIAQRFEDTWTKLRVFSLIEYDRMVFLDADMLCFRNMDELFDLDLPRDWIAANHACVCNRDKDTWALDDYNQDNCAFEGMKHPTSLTNPCPVPTSQEVKSGRAKKTHTLFNSGLFVFTPYKEQWDKMLDFFNTTPLLKKMMFPDQDFLAEYFKDRWMSIGYQYNATKTMRYWHSDMWRDDEFKNLHYIVDKPWSKRVGPDGKAGYLGRDGETHTWWWDAYEVWLKEREEQGETAILEMMRANVAPPLVDGEQPKSLHGNWKANPSAGEKVEECSEV